MGELGGVEGVVDMASRRRGVQAYFMVEMDADAVNREDVHSVSLV